MNRTFGRKTLVAAVSTPILALTLLGPTTAEAGAVRTDGPCYVVDINVGDRQGARSICPPGTWMHWHQVHVRCRWIAEPTEHGPIVGGTSVSEVFCDGPHYRVRSWNTQGPDHP